MASPLLVAKSGKTDLCLLPALANRHGLITGAAGHPVRATISDMGPLLLKARAEQVAQEQVQPKQGSLASDILFGKTGPRGGKQSQGLLEAMAKSAARTVGSQVGREIIRGVLGSILGKRR